MAVNLSVLNYIVVITASIPISEDKAPSIKATEFFLQQLYYPTFVLKMSSGVLIVYTGERYQISLGYLTNFFRMSRSR